MKKAPPPTTEEKVLKILWHSNAPWVGTGYGVQTKIAVDELSKLGHEITISAFYGVQGASLNAPGGFLVLPSHEDSFGNDVVAAHWKFTASDLVISLIDAWVLSHSSWSQIPWAAWLPIDHQTVPAHVSEALINGNAIPIAMSQHGRQALIDAGHESLYVPHSIDPVYLEDMPSRTDIRKGYKWDDKFVVGMVAANKGHAPHRKCFPQVFEAFAEFHNKHPESIIYLHTDRHPSYGDDLPTIAETLGIPGEAILFVDEYRHILGMGPEYMRNTYSAFDVLANPSMGEGFGVPIIEAQAVGTPVIVADSTSMPELCFNGKIVGGKPFYTNQDAFQLMPDVGEIYDAMEWAYGYNRNESNSRKWVLDNYSPEVVTKKWWIPTLEAIMERLEGRTFDYE